MEGLLPPNRSFPKKENSATNLSLNVGPLLTAEGFGPGQTSPMFKKMNSQERKSSFAKSPRGSRSRSSIGSGENSNGQEENKNNLGE